MLHINFLLAVFLYFHKPNPPLLSLPSLALALRLQVVGRLLAALSLPLPLQPPLGLELPGDRLVLRVVAPVQLVQRRRYVRVHVQRTA